MTDTNRLTGALPSEFGEISLNPHACFFGKICVARLLSCLIFGSRQLTPLLFSACVYFIGKQAAGVLSDPFGVAGNCSM
jgi:hypothetical protein